jgi:hypothetical protein
MNWHLFALSEVMLVASQLMSHLLDTKSTPKERASLSVLRENQVVVIKSGCSTNTRSLFTKLSHIE